MCTAFESKSEINQWIYTLSLFGYQGMSKGSAAIWYSNVMRLLCHANILLQLKQKSPSIKEQDDPPFQVFQHCVKARERRAQKPREDTITWS